MASTSISLPPLWPRNKLRPHHTSAEEVTRLYNSYKMKQLQDSKQTGGHVLVLFRCVKYLDMLFKYRQPGVYDVHVGQTINISRLSNFISELFSALGILWQQHSWWGRDGLLMVMIERHNWVVLAKHCKWLWSHQTICKERQLRVF